MTKAAVEKLNFEEALEELETVVHGLEGGKGNLNEAITSYERGVALKKHCEAKLKEAQEKVEKIMVSSDGKVSTVPFETK